MADSKKHTEGPWEYGVRKDGSIWLSIGDPVKGPHRQGDLCAREEDARLISAAPDLYSLAIELESYFEQRADADMDQDGYVPNEEMRVLVDIRAAIAKAEGRS